MQDLICISKDHYGYGEDQTRGLKNLSEYSNPRKVQKQKTFRFQVNKQITLKRETKL